MEFNFVFLSNQIFEDLVKSMAGERLGIHSLTIKISLMSTNIYCRLFVLFIHCQVSRSTIFLTEILFVSLHHYWRCKILVFCGCFISSNVLFVFSVMLASIVIIVCRVICLVSKLKFYSPCVFSIYVFCMRLSLSLLHSLCVYMYHFCIPITMPVCYPSNLLRSQTRPIMSLI